jgi:hypothetical protein
MKHFKLITIFSLFVIAIKAKGEVLIQDRFGKQINYLFRNCENHLYFFNSNINLDSIKLLNGELKGKIGANGIKIFANAIETKIIITIANVVDTIVLPSRSLPIPKIDRLDTYSITNGVKINLTIDSSFIALCPDDNQYFIFYKAYIINKKSKESIYYGREIFITSGINLIKLEDWFFTEKMNDMQNCYLYLEAAQFIRKNSAGEFLNYCSASAFMGLTIIE